MSTSSVSSASTTTPPVSTSSTADSTGVSSKIDGLISGLDTTSIINAIMQQAAQPQTNLKNQLAIEQAKLAAYQTINTKMSALQTAADALTSPSTWQAMAVTSTSASVSASASAGSQAGSFSFDVTQLARGQSSTSAGIVSSTSTVVATGGTGSVTITTGSGDPVTIDTGDGSLAAVVAGINKANAGVQAAAVQVSAGQYRLQLTSTSTGSDASFSVAGLDSGPLGTMNNTSNAQDAVITVGAGTPGEYTISSSSNTFNQAIPGLTFTVSQLTSDVTLTTASDSSGISDQVQAMVDAANAVLTEIGNDTAFNTQTDQASVLTGDFSAHQLQDSILSTISSAIGNGVSASSVGLAVTKDGQITFDSDAFAAAFAANPSAVQSAFTASGSFTPAAGSTFSGGITLQKGSDATQAGSYAVNVTQAATQASATIATPGGGFGAGGQTITLGSGGNTATYTVKSTDSVQTVIDALNAMSATNNLNINATLDDDGSTIDLTAAGYGAEYTFTASADGLTASDVTAGLDVAGTINGQAAKGIGQFLYTMSGTPGVDALNLLVTLDSDDVASLSNGDGTYKDAGTFTYAAGASQALATVANSAVAATTGSLTNEIAGENSTISDLNTQIANWQVTLDTKQAALETQWANLETQLSNLQGQSSSLSAALSALPGAASSSSSSSSKSS